MEQCKTGVNMRIIAFISSLLILINTLAYSETVDWNPDETIICSVKKSEPNDINIRTVVLLGGGAIKSIPKYYSDEVLNIKTFKNTFTVQLRDSNFTGVIQVFDDNNRLMHFKIKPVESSDHIDDMLVVRMSREAGAKASLGLRSSAPDSDGAVIDLMTHMLGGQRRSDISGTMVTRVEGGDVVPGRIIFEDDTAKMELIHVFQSSTLRGFHIVFTYRGKDAIRINTQRLWFPGAIAVHASDPTLMNQDNPSVEINPNQVIHLYYVSR